MLCEKCGHSLIESDKFCPNCGASVITKNDNNSVTDTSSSTEEGYYSNQNTKPIANEKSDESNQNSFSPEDSVLDISSLNTGSANNSNAVNKPATSDIPASSVNNMNDSYLRNDTTSNTAAVTNQSNYSTPINNPFPQPINNEYDESNLPKKTTGKGAVVIVICVAALVIMIIIALVIMMIIPFMTAKNKDADSYYNDGDFKKAADAYEQKLEDDFENTDVRINLARSLIEIGEYEDAINVLDYVFNYERGTSEVYEVLIKACGEARKDKLAKDYYNNALDDNIVVSLDNTPYAVVPDVVDMKFSKAEKLKKVNIVEDERVFDDADEDVIIEQTPEAGSLERASGGKVEVYVVVSDGPGEIILKNYAGKTVEEIEDELADDFTIEIEEQESSTIPSGKIIRTYPAAGATVMVDSTITVYVSCGEKMVSVPKITGKSLQEARTILNNLGLKIGNITYEGSDKSKDTVIDQTPSYKTTVKSGSKVDIVLSDGTY